MATNNKKLGPVLLISEELLKLYSPLSKNVSVDKVYPFLHLAQEYFLEDILGRPLLEELQEQVDKDELTPENKALILKIAPVLANYATYLAMRRLTYTVTEKSITKEKSDNSEALNSTELGEFILNLKQICEMHQEVLIKYLCNCADLYPLWRPSSYICDCSKYLPTDGSTEVNKKYTIYFPNKVKKDGCDKCDRDIYIKKY